MKKTTLISLAMLSAAWLAGSQARALEQDADGYYLIGSYDELAEWKTISGYEATNVRLNGDIDGVDFMLCDGSPSFTGTFDGQGHTITLNLEVTKEHGGLFFNFAGTLKNVTIDGKFTARNKNCSPVVGYSWSGNSKLENVVSAADVVVDFSANPSNGGLLGITKYNITINNCVSNIKVTGNKGYTHGFVGWMSGGVATITNSVSILEADETAANMSFSWGNPATLARISVSNSYSIKTSADDKDPSWNNTYATTEEMASGYVAYAINQKAGFNVLFQNLESDVDAYPVPFSTHGTVYANGQANCDGSAKEGSVITYSNTDALIQDAHVDVDGWCSVCGNIITDHITPVDGVYPLATAKDVVWFAAMVNEAGKSGINAALTADIDFSGIDFTPIGNANDNLFNGTFDGQRHNISNLVIESDATTPIGLFGIVGNTAVIKNLCIDGSCSFKGAGFVAGFAASAKQTSGSGFKILNCINAATVESTGSKAAAFYAQDPAGKGAQANFVIDNCVNAGTITAPGGGNLAAVFCGWTNTAMSYVYNSYNVGEVNGYNNGNILFYGGSRFMNNSYDLVYGTSTDQQGYREWMTAEPATSGELAARLGYHFYQDMANDLYPIPYYAEGRSRWNQITSAGYSTFYAKEATIIPAGVTAYTGKLDGDLLVLTAITGNIIPAQTPVVLQGAEGIYEMKVTTDGGEVIADNDLQASEETTDPDGTQYVLSQVDGEAGFYKAAIGLSGKWNYMIAPGRAFLVAPTAGVKGFTLTEDDATGIANGQWSMVNGQSIYNIAGQRIQKMQKGINIVGGRKVLK